jgi:hypothetical protein
VVCRIRTRSIDRTACPIREKNGPGTRGKTRVSWTIGRTGKSSPAGAACPAPGQDFSIASSLTALTNADGPIFADGETVLAHSVEGCLQEQRN